MITEEKINAVLLDIWTKYRVNPTVMYLGPYGKVAFDRFLKERAAFHRIFSPAGLADMFPGLRK